VPGRAEPFGSSVIRLDGSFNPGIVSIDWLLSKELIDEVDREYALSEERLLMSPTFTGTLYPWISVEVTPESLTVGSTDETETPERLREFVVGLMRVLPETPVRQLNINHAWHATTGADTWHAIANLLAPRGAWGDVAGDTDLTNLTRRADREGGHIAISLQPSERQSYDLFLGVMRSWILAKPPGVDPSAMISVLDKEWDGMLAEAERILAATLELA
jgi:hypothetical protein